MSGPVFFCLFVCTYVHVISYEDSNACVVVVVARHLNDMMT